MDILEVILLIVGIVIFIGSFLLPAGRSDAGRIDRCGKTGNPRSDRGRNENSPCTGAG